MRPLAILAPLLLAVAPAIAADEDTMRVALETVNGSRVVGTLKVKALKVRSDLGNLEVDLKQVKQINSTRPASNAYASAPAPAPPDPAAPAEPVPGFQVVMGSGTVIAGAELEARELQIDCELGTLTIAWEKVRTLEFLERAPRPVEKVEPVSQKPDEPPPAPQAESVARPVVRRCVLACRRWLRRMYWASRPGPFGLMARRRGGGD